MLRKIFKKLPVNIQVYLQRKITYLRNAPICFVCNILECFVDGKNVDGKNANVYYKSEGNSVVKRWDQESDEDTGSRYKYSFAYIEKNAKVLDCGCGSGRLHNILLRYVGTVNYLGLEISDQYVELAKKYGRNVKKNDLNDLIEFEKILNEFKPDVIYAMYFFYFLDEPERFLSIATKYSKFVIVGGKNHALWFNRLRFLIGRAPVTGSPLYHAYNHIVRNKKITFINKLRTAIAYWPRDVNKSYPRIWGYKDYKMLFTDLGLKYKYLCCRGHCVGDHYRKIFLFKLRAFGFQFVLYKDNK